MRIIWHFKFYLAKSASTENDIPAFWLASLVPNILYIIYLNSFQYHLYF